MGFRRRSIRWLTMIGSLGLVVPLLFATAPSAGASPRFGRPPGLQPTLVNVHPTLDRSLYGAQPRSTRGIRTTSL